MTIAKNDNLLGLLRICEGAVSVQINPQRCGSHSVIEWISGMRAARIIPSAEKVEMIEAGKVVWITFYLDRFGSPYEIFGATVQQVAFRAFALAKQVLGKTGFTFEYEEHNVTALLEELGEVCKDEVMFDMNDFKTTGWGPATEANMDRRAEHWFNFEKEISPEAFEPDKDGDVAYPPELVKQMVDANTIFDCHFYPTSSVGYYRLLHCNASAILHHSVTLAKADIAKYEALTEPRSEAVKAVIAHGFGTPVPELDPHNFTVVGGWKP